MTQPIERLSVFGLGKLGAVVAACHAARGLHVTGVDVDSQSVDRIRAGQAPVYEPGLDALFAENRSRLDATTEGEEAVIRTQATLLVVPTPSDHTGRFSLEYARSACESIGRGLRDKTDYHLVALKSTVLPGDCEQTLIPCIEEASGRRCGRDFGFCYNPEFIALGSVVRNLFEPDLVLIGASDERARARLDQIYAQLHESPRPTAHLNVVNAEIAKLSVNTFVTLKITYANLVAQLCEQIPGADAHRVTEALGQDSRIGHKYLKGALGFGGPCFPRDNRALLTVAESAGVSFPLAAATDAANETVNRRVVERVASEVEQDARIAVLGLAYKPDTPVVEASAGLYVARELAERGHRVVVYDPLAMELARRETGDLFKYAESAASCVSGADAVVIATPCAEYADVALMAAEDDRQVRIFDCWGIVSEPAEGLPNLWRLGVGPNAPDRRTDAATREEEDE